MSQTFHRPDHILMDFRFPCKNKIMEAPLQVSELSVIYDYVIVSLSIKRPKYIVPFLAHFFCLLWNSPNCLNRQQKHSTNIPVFENSTTRIHGGYSLASVYWLLVPKGSKRTNQDSNNYLLNTCSSTGNGHDGSQVF